MKDLSLRFIRWGAALFLIGLWTGYGPLGHYLHGGVEIACPWAPVHAHVVLLGWVGFTLFGLVYRALPHWGRPDAVSLRIARGHFLLSATSVLGVFANGIIGYRLLDRLSLILLRAGRGHARPVALAGRCLPDPLRDRSAAVRDRGLSRDALRARP